MTRLTLSDHRSILYSHWQDSAAEQTPASGNAFQTNQPGMKIPICFLTKEIPMFKELAPYLRQRAVLLTVTHLGEDRIRVNVMPKKLKDGENAALTTPLSVSGTAEELDRELPSALVSFVSAHLQLKNSLENAKAEMDAAAKTAQAEARSKSKTASGKDREKSEPAKTVVVKAVETAKPEPPRTASLFDVPSTSTSTPAPTADGVEQDILAEIADEETTERLEELDEAA